jgi:sarcosine oxidase subunit alpha
MRKLTDIDISNEGLSYLDAREAQIAGVPSLILRIGFVGELGYELHFPSPHGEFVWDTLLERGADLGARPFGLEPQRILRLEKGHVIVSQDTDSESNVLEAAMPWIFKADKPDFVGKWATEKVEERGLSWMLVGFESPTGVLPLEGGQIIVNGRSAGRVTSSRHSAELGTVIGLAILPKRLAVEGAEFDVVVDGKPRPMRVHLGPFFDPEGVKLKA